MELFDPFLATLEQALARPDADATRGAVWRWAGAQELIESRAFYEANPLWGIAKCAVHDLVAPDWLAIAYLHRFRSVTHHHVRTWDEAFGPAHPKGKNMAAARRAMLNRPKVALLFRDTLQRDPLRPVDKALWDEIGTAVGEGATRAEDLYREALQSGMATSASAIRQRAGVSTRRPAKFRKLAGLQKRPR